ncbi:MAG: RelA/SpoT family protein [Candidatus Moraniibacteriota bacterium]|jgi:GTP diphosphokinase / guanosine-3',5'-bis(diphosphate) 3'-diphosphatase
MKQTEITIDEVIKSFKNPPNHDGEKLVRNAFEFAHKAHGDQKRASGMPYIHHPLSTAKILATIGMDARTVAAGLLHDVPEDTSETLSTISKKFGPDISQMVEGITKLGRIKLRGTKEEHKLENWRRMFLAMGADIRTVIIKLADRLHNMQTLEHLRPDKRIRIANETMEIYVPIANRLGIGEIRSELADLSFMYLQPEEYKKAKLLSEEKLKEKELYVDKAIIEIEQSLKNEGIHAKDIHGRAKNIQSLHMKLQKHDMDINRVFDLIAVRVIVKDVAECYETLGIVHKKYRPMIGRIKDYISLPKPNGYQSIHTTVFGPDGRVMEIQIRTQKMHDEAEFGIAAHWLYETKKKKGWRSYFLPKETEVDKKEVEWVKQLQEWQEDLGNNPEEFMEGLKVDFLKNHIFAFTPLGDIIELPEGASVIDFAYAIHTDVGHTATGAKIDGKMSSLDSVVRNGQIIEIIKDKNRPSPNADWLNFVKTSHAKSAIRRAVNKENT